METRNCYMWAIRTVTLTKNGILKLILLSFVLTACNPINPTITKANYDCVQTGMTMFQVRDIMGKSGEISAEIAVNVPNVSISPGFPNLPTELKPAVYQWRNPDGSSMTAIFVNDKLVAKSQINLK